MRWRRPKKQAIEDRPEVRAHLHSNSEITLERLDSFAQAPSSTQLLVLGQLRMRAEDQEATLLPAIEALALATLALFLTVVPESMRIAVVAKPIMDPLGRWLSATSGMLIFGLMAVALTLPTIWNSLKTDRKRARAAAWPTTTAT